MSREIKKPRSRLEDWLTDDRLFLISCWARDYTMRDLAVEKIGISVKTLYEWMKKSDKFAAAIKDDREILDYRVENALLERALGCRTKETKVVIEYTPECPEGTVIQKEIRTKEHLPDTSAIFGWLNNRKPKEWRRNRDNTLELDDNDNNITVNIIKSGSTKSTEQQQTSSDDEWDAVEAELAEEV